MYSMISDRDITRLKEVFATKEDLGDLRVEVGELHDKIDTMQETLYAFVGRVSDVEMDNRAGAAYLFRHDRQIQLLAKEMGVSLPD